MKKIYLLVLVVGISSLSGCNEDSPFVPTNDSVPFEVDEFIFFDGRIETTSSEWKLPESESGVSINFDITEYPWAKRITFVPTIWTEDTSNRCFAELYNLSESKEMASSRVSTNNYLFTEVPSADIINLFPPKPIKLTIRIKSDKEGVYAASEARAFLIVHRE